MEDRIGPSRVVALFPFAVKGRQLSARDADLCRGFACFLERRLAEVPGVEAILQHVIVAPDSDPERRGWLMTNQLWSLEQALSLPLPEDPRPNFLIQGQARWSNAGLDVSVELIDVDAGFSAFRGDCKGRIEKSFPRFFALLKTLASELLPPAAARAVARVPTEDPEAFRSYLLALAAMQSANVGMGSEEQAFSLLVEAIERDGNFSEACRLLERLALAGFERGGEEGAWALSAIEHAHAAAPRYSHFTAILGMSLAGRGEGERAVEMLRGYLEAEPDGPFASSALVEIARVARLRGEQGEARTLLRRALDADPANVDAWEALASLHADGGNHSEAEECWRRALQEDPDRPETLRHLAESYIERGDWSKAAFLLDRAVTIDAGSPQLTALLIRALVESRDLVRADEVATEWVEQTPESWEAWLQLASIRRKVNQLPAAHHCLERVLALTSDEHARAGVALERFALDAPADYGKYCRILAVQPTSGFTADERRRYASAATQVLRELCARHDGVPALWSTLAEKAAQAELFSVAASAQKVVCAAIPGDAAAANLHGVLLARAGEPAAAQREFERACAIAPEVALYHLNRGMALIEVALIEDAEAALLLALELKPRDAATLDALKKLRTMQRERRTEHAESRDARPSSDDGQVMRAAVEVRQPVAADSPKGFLQRLRDLLSRGQ